MSPLVPVTITHPGGDRQITSYTMPEWVRTLEVTPEPTPGGGIRIVGDGGWVPTPLELTALVVADSLADAYALAYTIVDEAEGATAVAWHYATLDVDGLMMYRMEPDHRGVLLTLAFHMTGDAPPTGPVEAI